MNVLFSFQDVMALKSEPDSPLPYPIIADDKRQLSVQLGMLDPDEVDKDGIPLTARCVRPTHIPTGYRVRAALCLKCVDVSHFRCL